MPDPTSIYGLMMTPVPEIGLKMLPFAVQKILTTALLDVWLIASKSTCGCGVGTTGGGILGAGIVTLDSGLETGSDTFNFVLLAVLVVVAIFGELVVARGNARVEVAAGAGDVEFSTRAGCVGIRTVSTTAKVATETSKITRIFFIVSIIFQIC